MSIVSLQEILRDTSQNKYAVGMFDIHNLEMLNAAIAAAEQEKAPIIIALAQIHVTQNNLQELANIMTHAAHKTKVPVAIHFDHGTKFEYLLKVMKLGFSSVMYDGSALPFEENVRHTLEIVRIARNLGVSVEAELGHVGGQEAGEPDEAQMIYTDPSEAENFVCRTKVDALAVSIGTVHGVYKQAPCLDLQRLKDIHQAVHIPLVLHGGSGLLNQDFTNCIEAGISKINIYTEIVQAAARRIRSEVNGNGENVSYSKLLEKSTEEMQRVIVEKLRLFGAAGRA